MRLLFILMLLMSTHPAINVSSAQTPSGFDEFLEVYEQFREDSITDRFSRHSDIEPLILDLQNRPDFSVEKQGYSVEGRPLYLVKWGDGPKVVYMWSQMHGNEPTATMALMDIFNFLKSDVIEGEESLSRKMNDIKASIRQEITLLVLPMVNPDGAEVFKRRSALDVDLNRDALRLQHPESRILKEIRDKYNPLFGFNLHDQSVYYGTSDANLPVAMAFLAPAYNFEKDVNDVRARAKKLIAAMTSDLTPHIGGKIARYDDSFEPRAFGDNMQLWGTSTILVESGGYLNDPEKQYLRKLHFALLLASLQHIAGDSYRNFSLDDYEAIPMNRFGNVFDLIVKNGTVLTEFGSFQLDMGFRYADVNVGERRDMNESADSVQTDTTQKMQDLHQNTQTTEKSDSTIQKLRLTEIGDMSVFGGYEIFDAAGLTIEMLQLPVRPGERTLQDVKDYLKSRESTESVTPTIGDIPVLLFFHDGNPVKVLINNEIRDIY